MKSKMKKSLLLLIVIPVLMYTLSSCSMGPDFQKPEVETPAQCRYDSLKIDSVATLKWWDLFNDPVLDTLIITALRENKDLLLQSG